MPAKWQQWMPCFIDRWRGSPSVRAMHPAARDGYRELLCTQWESEDCTIPNDPLELAEKSGLGDELWSTYSVRILRNFQVLPNGRLQNRVCLEEWSSAKRIFEARQEAARKTTRIRSPRKKSTVTVPKADGDREISSRSADTRTLTVTTTETEKQKTKATPKAAPFALPAWISAPVWNDFEEARRKIRAPMTDAARRGIVGNLDALRARGHPPDEVLAQSITRGWRGVFELKATGGNGNGKLDKHEQMRRDDEELFGADQRPEENLERPH